MPNPDDDLDHCPRCGELDCDCDLGFVTEPEPADDLAVAVTVRAREREARGEAAEGFFGRLWET